LCAALQIGVALGLTFLLALFMNWPVKTAVLLGFIVSLSSTAVAITGESGTQRDALLLSFFSPDKKSRLLRGGVSR
jgi:predicted Kef-type K+ transport protein